MIGRRWFVERRYLVSECEVPSPVTKERVKKFLCELDQSDEGFEYHEYGDNEFMFPTESAILFVNFSNPSVLNIRGQWRGIARDEDSFAALTVQVHQCNVQRSGPKAYLLPLRKEGHFGLGAETNLVVSQGSTQAQLTEFYEVALTMIIGFFHDVEAALPQLVYWKEAPTRDH